MKLTIVLILINVIIFLYSLMNFEHYITEYGFKSESFIAGRYGVAGTAMFLHAGFSHLLFNMIALFFLGSSLEKKVESWEYLLVYLLGGIVGNLAVLIFYSPDIVVVGASGAISALVGLGTFCCPERLIFFQSIIPLPFVVAGALYFLTTLMNLFVPSQVAYPVHFVGMIVGSIFGLMWSKERTKRIFMFVITLLLIVLLPYILG